MISLHPGISMPQNPDTFGSFRTRCILIVENVLFQHKALSCVVYAWFNILVLFSVCFIAVLTMLMVPGLRQKGILQQYCLKYWLIVKRLLYGRLQVLTEKKNE
jgi:hypothetical protein